MEVLKKDWKLFREKISDWQEVYMERLTQEYITLLSGKGLASDKFWELEKRIRRDSKMPGVIIQLQKSEMVYDIVTLINDGVITQKDLEGFSDELKEQVRFLIDRRYGVY